MLLSEPTRGFPIKIRLMMRKRSQNENNKIILQNSIESLVYTFNVIDLC
uniref:Uncharacterized protein n=1 Tax=Curvibacter symbiont subsp. Hydra magnipapillata TaxID=667019 RepID=C9Y6Q1_CURXX|nr:hypothetical protein Csp_E36280 [Curvibacter putative symbiont of Hydra magnipapillata]